MSSHIPQFHSSSGIFNIIASKWEIADRLPRCTSSPITSSKLPTALGATEEEIQLVLAAQCHTSTKNCDKQMESYVWKWRTDGRHIFNIGKTLEKLLFAARIITAVENPNDVRVIPTCLHGYRVPREVLKYATDTGAQAIAGRFTPGSFTNYVTRSFKEPRLIVVTDPRVDHQAIREASYINIPVIALCDTDAPLKFVDIAIPTNNKTRHSIGLICWLLAREVVHLCGTIARTLDGWNVMVDMFFYCDPEEVEKLQAEEAAAKNIVTVQLNWSADVAGTTDRSMEPTGAAGGWAAVAPAASTSWD